MRANIYLKPTSSDDYVHIAPGANLGGDVVVGRGTLIGIGAAVMPQLQLGEWSTIGAGAVVTKNVPAMVTAVGVPAQALAGRQMTNPAD